MPSNIDDLARRLVRLVETSPPGKYRLGSRVTPEDLERFEQAAGATLPEDYRAFLLAVGEGASGPVYGLLTLKDSMAERREGIYGLADPFPAPESTLDHVDFNVGGILPISYDGCSYFHGLVVSGRDRGQMWFSLEDRPGWVPSTHGSILGPDGEPFQRSDDYAALYDALLDKKNEGARTSFAAWYARWLDGEEKSLGGGAA